MAAHRFPFANAPAPARVAALLAAALLAALFVARAARAADAAALLVIGDSISAAYGLSADAGWVALLGRRLEAGRYPLQVINASITGDTTAGGRARLPALLERYKPAIVVIELGGNDGLRGGSLRAARDNLDAMVAAVQRAGAKAIIVGMKLPPNYGPAYTREFEALYPAVAKAHKAALVPFFFAGFGESDEFFQPDRIHPTAAAQQKLLDNVWPILQPLLPAPRR